MSVEVRDFGGKLTPQQILIESTNDAEDMATVVVVYIDNDNYIFTSSSSGSALRKLGMLDVAKDLILRSLKDST